MPRGLPPVAQARAKRTHLTRRPTRYNAGGRIRDPRGWSVSRDAVFRHRPPLRLRHLPYRATSGAASPAPRADGLQLASSRTRDTRSVVGFWSGRIRFRVRSASIAGLCGCQGGGTSMKSVCVLLSGGIDSMVASHLLIQEGIQLSALFVDYGQAARQQEAKASRRVAKFLCIEHQIISIKFPCKFASGEIPFRNGLLVYAAAVQSKKNSDIALGVHAGVPYPDCSVKFLDALEVSLVRSNNLPVRLIAPLKTWTKSEIIAYTFRENLPIGITYSCEFGAPSPCGVCFSCLDRTDIDVSRKTPVQARR